MTLFDQSTDFYSLFSDITGEDLEHWKRARSFEKDALPRINDDWDRGHYPTELVVRLGELGLLNDGVEVPGIKPMSHLASGLVHMEIARIDGSMAVAIGVQAALCMRSISLLGTEQQKQEWLPDLAAGRKFGAFAMTEPDHGSDAVAMETSARLEGDTWVLNGQKRWIGNGSVGDVTVVWARMENGKVGAFIVPQDSPGYQGETIKGKASMRAVHQALITLNDCRIPAANRLPGAESFKDAGAILLASRVSVVWTALGHAIAAYEAALEHSKTRIQFGKPLGSFQIIQLRLADMLGDVTNIAMHCHYLVEKQATGELTGEQASLAKVQCTRAARRVVADAREMLGGSGILLENDVARHFADMEAVHTFEGTDTMQSLTLGRVITGFSAFK